MWVIRGGFTNYGPPLRKAFDEMNKIIKDKDFAFLCLYTDGNANYDEDAMGYIHDH